MPHTICGRKNTKLALGLAATLLCFTQASAAPRPGTVGMDYRNAPNWTTLVDFERVVLSPRAAAAGDSLRARGVKVYWWLQPALPRWDGQPVKDWPVDAAEWWMTDRYGAILSDSLGVPAPFGSDNMNGSYAPDFRVPGYPEALGAAVAAALPPGDGILMDYGCTDLRWFPEFAKLGVDWQQWGDGYRRYRAGLNAGTLGLPQLGQCQWLGQWLPTVVDALCMEDVGKLNTYASAWGLAQGRPLTIMACRDLVPQHRRCVATMALVAGCGFYWTTSWNRESLRDPEHFEFSLGTPGTSVIMLAPGVYFRPFSRGYALVNLSAMAYSYQNLKVAPNDGLVVQTRDERGRWIVKRTNQGR